MKKLFFFTMIFVVNSLSAQSDLEKILKGGEIIVNGLSILKTNNSKSEKNLNWKYIESVCVKNKLTEKITFKLFGKDSEDFEEKKKW